MHELWHNGQILEASDSHSRAVIRPFKDINGSHLNEIGGTQIICRTKKVMDAVDSFLFTKYPNYWSMNSSDRDTAFGIAFGDFATSLSNTGSNLSDLACGSIYENHMIKRKRDRAV